MGTESLRVIGCIFAENGPLEGGIESSFWGTGWGAKGDFMRYPYLYLYIFESRTHTFFESTCPELYAQQSWEWSDAYSWRNDLWKVNFKRASKKPAGVLIVIWSGFLAPTRAFSKEAPTIFRKRMPWGIGTESLGMMGCIFVENGPLESGIESSFSGAGWGAKGDFRWIFYPNLCIFERGPAPFFRMHMPSGMGTESLGMIGCIFAENGSLEYGVLAVISNGFVAPTLAFAKGTRSIFRKHMPWGICTENCRMFGCIFAENGSLEGGIEARFSSNGWGV